MQTFFITCFDAIAAALAALFIHGYSSHCFASLTYKGNKKAFSSPIKETKGLASAVPLFLTAFIR
jgi:hypothetical protein